MDAQQRLLISAHFDATKALSQVRMLSKAVRDQSQSLTDAASRARDYAQAQGRMGQGMRSVRGVAQQAGYQIADLAIVLQQGQDGFKAMAIQGGQFVGALGPMGAALGGVLTVGGLVLSVFKQMREEGGTIPPMMASILDAFAYWGAFMKAVALPNLKQFITDVKWAWENLEGFRLAVIGMAGALTVLLTPAIYALAKSLVVLAVSNPFTALALAATAAAVAIIANWDKVKIFFEFGMPAALELAAGAFYNIKAAAFIVVRDVWEYVTGLVNGPLNDLGESLNNFLNLGRSDKMQQVWEPFKVGGAVMDSLNAGITSAMKASNDAYVSYAELSAQYQEAMAANNVKRAEAIALEMKQTEAIEKTKGATVEAVDAFKKWQEENILTNQLLEHGLGAGLDGLIDTLFDAEKSFKDFAKTFLTEIGKMIAKQILLNAISGMLGGPAANATGTSIMKQMLGFKQGGVFAGGAVTAFANGGVVNGPTVFPMATGMGLMGEAGPEAVMPLQRNSKGELGVSGPAIQINNYGNSQVEVTRSDEEVIEIAIGRVRSEFTQSMRSGQGAYARSLEQGYSSRRRAK